MNIVRTETGWWRTQQALDEVSIDKNGTLSVKSSLSEVHHLTVKAESPIFHTSSVYEVTAIPAVKKVSVEPETITFYVGSDAQQIMKATLDPATVPPIGIT